jgi:hypothetical protein
MDLAPIVITASAIIIILQVISIVLIIGSRKTVVKPEAAGVNPVNNDNRDFRKRRDENRFNKRPPIDQRQRPFTPPPQQPQAVDTVEKSLRDINLRLKNAERDQESARRKIKDVIQNPQNQQDPQRRFDQNNNRPNRGRDDDFRRRDRDRDRHNRPHGGHFRDRDQNRGPEPLRPQSEAAAPVSAQAAVPVIPPSMEAARPQNPVAAQPVVEKKEPIAIVPENTEVLHGRKVLVRRRIITNEEQAQAGQQQQESKPVIGEVAPLEPENPGQTPPSSEPAAPQSAAGTENELQNINFGR